MSDGMNRATLLGHLGQDPELRRTQTGSELLTFRLATNERYTDKAGQAQERTDWHTVVVWGNRAEPLSKMLRKGMLVLVEGSLRTSSYEKDGVKRYKTEVIAREVHFLGGRGGVETTASMPGAANGTPPRSAFQEELDAIPY